MLSLHDFLRSDNEGTKSKPIKAKRLANENLCVTKLIFIPK